MGPGQRLKRECFETTTTDHVFSSAEFTGHDHPRLVRVNISTVVKQIVVRLKVVEEDHGDASSADMHDLACRNQLVRGMGLGWKTSLTVLLPPLRRPEPQFFGGQVERIPNQRERFGPRR